MSADNGMIFEFGSGARMNPNYLVDAGAPTMGCTAITPDGEHCCCAPAQWEVYDAEGRWGGNAACDRHKPDVPVRAES